MEFNPWAIALHTTWVLMLFEMAHFSFEFARHRRRMAGLPGPKHSFIFGHLRTIARAMSQFPADIHFQVPATMLGEQNNMDVFYLDLWPFAPPFLMIHNDQAAAKITRLNLPKHPLLYKALSGIADSTVMVTSEGAEWRALRSMFGPGFSHANLIAILPDILDVSFIFRDRLRKLAETAEEFSFLEVAANATIDIMGKLVMGEDFNSQRSYHPLVYHFRALLPWCTDTLHPIKTFIARFPLWWHWKKLDQYISTSLNERFQTGAFNNPGSKVAIDLALQVYIKEQSERVAKLSREDHRLDKSFESLAITNIKGLILGGHDTTASTIAYLFYFVSTYPDWHAKLCEEHDQVLGHDPAAALNVIRQRPQVLNELPITTAALHETLRMFPPAGAMRMCADETFIEYGGEQFPLQGCCIWINHPGLGLNEKLWPNAAEFDPGRFLPLNSSPKEAWRPFEKGPRVCIAQELAMMEMKILLVAAIRELEFKPMYNERCPSAPERYGGQHYSVVAMGPKPSRGMPMTVKLRTQAR